MVLMFDSLTLDVITFITTITVIFYLYFTRKYKQWKNLGVPYIKPFPFLGNFKDVVLQKYGIGPYLKNVYLEYRDRPYVGIFAFHQPALVINDLDLVKKVLVKDAQVFIDRKFAVVESLDPLLYNSIFALKGQRWKHVRNSLSPTFTSGKMKNMFYLVKNCAQLLIDYVDKTQGTTVQVKEAMARFTTDVIGTCAFGIDTGSLQRQDAEFRVITRKIFDFTIFRAIAAVLAFISPDIVRILRLQVIDNDVNDLLRNSIWETLEYREKNGIIRKDFLDNLVELRKKMQEEGSPFINKDTNKMEDLFVGQCFNFLAAGFETSSTTSSFLLYELALHPEMQQRLRSEILDVMSRHEHKVTYDGIQQMTYLDMVISETLRKYPVLPFLDRNTTTDYELPAFNGNGTVTIPAGTLVLIPLLGIHHDPKYYPQPDRFDPERFTDENKTSRPAFTFAPFGEGPRICIGMRFGLMQLKTGLVYILSNYEISPCEGTPIPVKFDPKQFLLSADGSLPLNFTKISA